MLPLTLSPFEQMMVADDSRAYPMVSIVELSLVGSLNRDALESACSVAFARHPLLRSRVQRTLWGALRWVPAEPPCVEYLAESPAELDAHIDLSSRAGVRIMGYPTDSGTRLIVEAHHASCDGVGLFQFIEDVFVGYANLCSSANKSLNLRTLEGDRLKRRNRFAWNSATFWQWLYNLYFGSSIVLRFSANSPMPLGLPAPSHTSTDRPVRITLDGDSSLLARLRTAAVRHEVTLNDLLARDLFLAIRDWNAGCGDTSQTAVRRILIPCDLRSGEDVATPAANIMSYAFLNRSNSDCEQPDDLLRGIQSEMEYIRTQKASLFFIRTLEVIRCLPGAMAWKARTEQCFATCLMSNIGDPSLQFTTRFPREQGRVRIGNVLLDRIVSYPPVRRQTRAGLIVATYANRLCIGCRFDAKHFRKHDGQRFVDIFFRYLKKSAAGSR